MYQELTYCSAKGRRYQIPPRKVEFLKVISVSFCQDTDLVSTGFNDSIAFHENDGSTNVLTASIPQGSYTIANFGGVVAQAMSSAGTQPYQVSYSEITRRLTIATTGGKDFKILPKSRGTTASSLIGMDATHETGYGKSFQMANSVNLSNSYPLLLTSSINVSGTRYLSDFNDFSDSTILCTICPDSINDICTWANPGEWLSCDETISTIEFHLIDSQTYKEVSLSSPLTVTIGFQDEVPSFSSR